MTSILTLNFGGDGGSNPRPKQIPPKRLQFSPLNDLTWLQSTNNFTPSDSLNFRG